MVFELVVVVAKVYKIWFSSIKCLQFLKGFAKPNSFEQHEITGEKLHCINLASSSSKTVVTLTMDFLIDRQIFSFCPDQHGAEAFNHNNATQTYSIFAKKACQRQEHGHFLK